MFQRINLSMGSRGIRDIPTIFHPQQTHASTIILGDNQQNHGSRSSTGQVPYDNSGKHIIIYNMYPICYIELPVMTNFYSRILKV